MAESIVQKKLARLIQQEVSTILVHGNQYVPGAMITVSLVRITADLGLAKIYLTAFPDNLLPKAVETMNEHNWEVRKKLASKIKNKVRIIPEIRFYKDDSFIEAEKIDRLLNEIKEDE